MQFAPDQPHPLFDGVSDFSILASNVATTVVAIFRNRLESLINAQMITPKLNIIFNRIINLLPAQIPIGPFDLVGFLAGNPTSNALYTHIPMRTTVTSDDYPYPGMPCTVTLPEYISTEEYQIEF